MFSLIASMLSSSAGTARETAVFNNTNTESDPGHHFLTDINAVESNSIIYTDWLFTTCLAICAQASLNDNQAD